MIYYSNSPLETPHMTFIGRWSPFHNGHKAIITKKITENPLLPVLILVRHTLTDQYTASARAMYIKQWMTDQHIKGTIMIIPNVEGVYWGRGVGYKTEPVSVDEAITSISGTDIRRRMQDKKSSWHNLVAVPESAYLLTPAVSSIVEQGLVVWLTGCPSSGKTTIARAFIHHVAATYPHLKTQLLDGDDMRATPVAAGVGFSKKDRADHILRMAYIAKMFADHGILVVCAFVSPDRRIRMKAKKIIGKNRYIEVYVRASKSTRMKRDTKGMYKQAAKGALQNFTGYNAFYEAPKKPDVLCDTDTQDVSSCVTAVSSRVFSRSTSHTSDSAGRNK